jgi:hypothetical protein
VTRAEIEAHIRQFNRTCRGHLLIPQEYQQPLIDRWQKTQDAGDVLSAIFQILALELHQKSGHLDLPDTNWETLYRRFSDLRDMRKGCGFDFNDLILSLPFDRTDYSIQEDGTDKRLTCPQCGIRISFLAPSFEDM